MQSNHNVENKEKKQTKKERKKPDTLFVAKMRFERKKRNAETETEERVREGGRKHLLLSPFFSLCVFFSHDWTLKPLLYLYNIDFWF